MTPIRRDTTILGAIPGNGTYHDPEGIPSQVKTHLRMAGVPLATEGSRGMDAPLSYHWPHDARITNSNRRWNKRRFTFLAR